MATTTNYSWSTPDDTALVKDGAAAIRTLGSSADTTVKALNPGTTAGDLDYYTTSTAKARVGIGTAGQLLRVNSGATAPEWATISTGGMTLLSTTNLSSTTTTISGISGSYNNLIILVQNPYVSAGSSIYIKPNNANLSRNMFIRSTSVSSDTNAIEGNSNLGTTTAADAVGYVAEIYNYADTTYAKPYSFWGNAASGANNMARFGILTTASAITSLDVTTFGGTATFSGGRVLIYGVK
jgi:hypothetical protein